MTRQHLMVAALAATLALTAWTAWLPETDVPAVVGPARDSAVPPPAAMPRAAAWPRPAPLALHAWAAPVPAVAEAGPPAEAPPPEAPPPAPAVAAAPAAPALPWRWIGRLDDAAGRRVLLEGPTAALLVREREVLDGQWRLDRIGDDLLEWRWLPGDLPLALKRP